MYVCIYVSILTKLITDAENDPITFVNVIIYERLPEETLTISPADSTLRISDTQAGLILFPVGVIPTTEFERVLQTMEYQNSLTT